MSNILTHHEVALNSAIAMSPLHNNDVLFIVLMLVPLTNVSCFLYTCASVAIAVPVLVASDVLEGTTGLVLNVLVHATV